MRCLTHEAQATHDGLSSVFLPRNTRVPAKKTKAGVQLAWPHAAAVRGTVVRQVFSTAEDNQARVTVPRRA